MPDGTPALTGDAYRDLVMSDAPFAYYRLDDTGTTAKDQVAGRDGTYKGAVAHASGAIAGDPSTAAVFDGVASYVEVTDSLPLTGNAPFTIEAWASPVAGASDPGCVVARTFAIGGANGSVTNGTALYVDNTNNGLELTRFQDSANDGPSGPTIPNNAFAHLVATYDGSRLELYVDGKHVAGTGSSAAVPPVSQPLTIGAGRGGIYCYFRGALDEVALYDKPLASARIAAHHAAGITK
jgi:hypothetical protein